LNKRFDLCFKVVGWKLDPDCFGALQELLLL